MTFEITEAQVQRMLHDGIQSAINSMLRDGYVVYAVDDGSSIHHRPGNGAVELAEKLLGTIREQGTVPEAQHNGRGVDLPDWVAGFINRRTAVEQELFDCASGKKPPPDREQCRAWALRLGVPEEYKT